MSGTGPQVFDLEAYLATPLTKDRYDIVDGIRRKAPKPTVEHQLILMSVCVPLSKFVGERQLGVVIPGPVDVVIQREPLRIRQPDILYINAERTKIRGGRDLDGMQLLDVPPDLIVEIHTLGDTQSLIEERLEDYRSINVFECWLVNLETDTVEVLKLSPEGISTEVVYGPNDTLHSEVLQGFLFPWRTFLDNSKTAPRNIVEGV
jgi:Uma2 family endonuclease